MVAVLALFPIVLSAQQMPSRDTLGVIMGRVVDSVTGEPRLGATVSIPGTTRGTSVDSDGRFVISAVAPGTYNVRARLFGYTAVDREVSVRRADTVRVDFVLAPTAALLGAVRTQARPVDRDAFEMRPNIGTVSVTGRAASSVPRLGEPDIIRVVQLLPGVEARNDFSTGLNVRGGESDQNLIMLDGFPIYNPFHLGGLFSTFIDPTVRDVTLLTGGFPARYGGRLSSVLDIRSAEEARTGIHGSAEVSVIASTGSLGGSFAGGRGSWMIAGRRTYADKFVAMISDKTLPYHFRDEQGHATYDLGGGTKLSLTAYDGADVLDADLAQFGDSTGSGTSGGRFQFSWGNRIVGATLSKSIGRWALGDSALLEQRISDSHFATTLDLGQDTLTLNNRVIDRRIAGSLSTFSSRHDRTIGYDVTSFHIDYFANSSQTDASFYSLEQRPVAASLYYDDLWRVSQSLMMESGVRLEGMSNARWSGLSPRLSAKYFLTPDFALTGAVGRYAQWTHSLAREDIPVRLFDFWVTSDSTTPVSTAWHYILGGERWLGTHRYLRLESFYKQYGQLLESNPQEDPGRRGDEFFSVNGHSYGADVLLRQFESGGSPFSGWVSYTYAMSSRTRDGATYFPGHDRRHNLNIVGNWRSGRYTFGARYGLATGTPYTPIVGEITRRIYDPIHNSYTSGSGDVQFIGGARNSARLPSTQRFDVSVTYEYKWRGASVAPYLSIVNAANAKNVFIYIFDYSKSPPTRQAISQFPFLPSVGATIHF